MSVLQSADGRPYPAADAALQRAFDSAREIMQGHLESTHSVYSNSCWQVLLSLLSVRSGQSSSSADAPSSAEGNRSASCGKKRPNDNDEGNCVSTNRGLCYSLIQLPLHMALCCLT